MTDAAPDIVAVEPFDGRPITGVRVTIDARRLAPRV
jgi:hypothetical protein